MSGGIDVLKIKEDDVTKMLSAKVHVGSENSETTMDQYVFKKTAAGTNIIDLNKTWEKLMLAARAIAAIENPQDVFVASSKQFGQRAVLKFAHYIGASSIAGRFTPGAFTNQIQCAFREPRLLVVCDPRADQQPVTEGSYANIPIIAFCNVDSPTKFIDVAIPCNNKAVNSIGVMWWFLAREVLRIRGTISRETPWEVMPDLFFYRDPEDAEKEEAARLEEKQNAERALASAAKAPEDDWNTDAAAATDWAAEPAVAAAVPMGVPGVPVAGAVPQKAYTVEDDWAQPQVQSSNWAEETSGVGPAAGAPAPAGNQWGGSSNWA